MEPTTTTIECVPGVPLEGQPAPPPNESAAVNLPDGGDAEPKKRKKKEVPEHLKPEALASFDAETVKLVNEQDREIDELHSSYTESKEETKERKMAWEAKRDTLQRVIKERKANRGKPVQKTLLSDLPPEPTEAAPANPVTAAPVVEPSALDLLYRQYPLDRCMIYGMTEKDVEIMASGERKGGLATIPVRTVGEMADYSAGDGAHPRHIADFKGLGASGATRIEAALEGFWGWWNGGGMTEFAHEKGIPDAVNGTESGGRGEVDGDGGEGHVQGERGGAGDGDDQDGEDTVVIVEHFLNDPDAPLNPTDEDLAQVPEGNDAEYSLAGEGEKE